jgi:hypothetical protein
MNKTTAARITVPTSSVDTKMIAPRSFAGVGGVIPTVRINACETARNGFFMGSRRLDRSQLVLVQAATIEDSDLEFFAKAALFCPE